MLGDKEEMRLMVLCGVVCGQIEILLVQIAWN